MNFENSYAPFFDTHVPPFWQSCVILQGSKLVSISPVCCRRCFASGISGIFGKLWNRLISDTLFSNSIINIHYYLFGNCLEIYISFRNSLFVMRNLRTSYRCLFSSFCLKFEFKCTANYSAWMVSYLWEAHSCNISSIMWSFHSHFNNNIKNMWYKEICITGKQRNIKEKEKIDQCSSKTE